MLQDVMTALRAGDTATALATATRWTTAEPQNADALFWLAQACGAAGDLAGAGAALDQALAVAPQRADLMTLRGYLDLQGGDLAKAEASLSGALVQDPNQFQAYIGLAHLALARGDRTDTERHVAFAKRVNAEHPRVLLLEAMLAAGQPDQAERVLTLLTAAADRAPNDAMVLSALGVAFLERQHFAFAEQTLRKALALTNASPALHAPLIAALDAQGKGSEALAVADAWVRQAGTPSAHWNRAQLRVAAGQVEGARADLDAVLAVFPQHVQAFELSMQLLGQAEGQPAVMAVLETRVVADPGFALAWRLLLNLQPIDEAPALVQRWLEAAPDHPAALDVAATLAEREGRQGDALAYAERALAAEPRLREAALLRARATALLMPEAAVTRMEALLAAASTPEQARSLSGWQAHALHRAGRVDDALRAWGRMWMGGPAFGLPLPNPEPAAKATPAEDGGAGRLLWGLPGSRVERLHAALIPVGRNRLMIDRFRQPMRDDGFNPLRAAPDHALAGTAARWRQPLEAAGLEPANLIDALPFWDGWTQATLHGTTLVAVLRDPRDLLLNWMAWGSAAGFAFPSPAVAAAWLHRQLDQLLAAEAANPTHVVRIDADLLDRDPEALAAQLVAAFGLEDAPDMAAALALAKAPNGGPTDFVAGSWRQYAEPMKALFVPLGEMAVRLGYPAE
ncbi:tetratricopeptide repeat protein [Silanimonas sp.]|jgi:tetratricopeptide (TPR) repeat protein|uniref:tetratricopeptide repeat protein n=1 Tax=Silanimonas sp. TaxID=1929290 RepID=UPI0037CA3B8B